MLSPLKTLFSFGCGFCGAGNRMYKNVEKAIQAGNKHNCKCQRIVIYKSNFYAGYKKPVTSIVTEAK
jgi:hypothetical protein